jgi:choline dehydrogenase
LHLRSSDPFAPPVIETGYLSHPDDLRVLLDGMQVVQKISQAPAFKAVSSGMRVLEGCPVPFTGDGTAYFTWVVQHLAFTLYHPVGTCKMGAAADPSSELLFCCGVYSVDFTGAAASVGTQAT